jgi:hypothetical protein
MRWVGNVACVEEKKNVRRVVVGKPETKGILGRCRHRGEDNNKMYIKHVEWRRRLD